MPNIWTHICYCESLADITKNPEAFAKVDALMKLGAQGPHPFFYYKFWPWANQHQGEKINSLFYTEQSKPFIMDLIKTAQHKRKEVKAYVFGLVAHFILEEHIRPFIHYYAGDNGKAYHQLETSIDTMLMKKYYNLETWKVLVYKEIDVGFSLDTDIAKALHQAMKTYFPEINITQTTYIQKSYRNMKRSLKLLTDPLGWKHILFGSKISPYSYRPLDFEIDYLNTAHDLWVDPTTNEARTESFMELFEQAKITGRQVINELLDFWYEESDLAKKRLEEQLLQQKAFSMRVNEGSIHYQQTI